MTLGATSVSTGFSSPAQTARPDPKKHVIGIYESLGTGLSPSQNAGMFFHGMGLVDGTGTAAAFGLGFFGGTNATRPCLIASIDPTTLASVAPSGETLPTMYISGSYIGVNTTVPSKALDVIGDCRLLDVLGDCRFIEIAVQIR